MDRSFTKSLVNLMGLMLLCIGTSACEELAPQEKENSLLGQWVQDCQNSFGVSSSQSELYFSTNEVVLVTKNYSEIGCLEEDLLTEITKVFDYHTQVTLLRTQLKSNSVAIHTQDLVDSYNNDGVCGLTWSLGQSEEITGLACDVENYSRVDEANFAVTQNGLIFNEDTAPSYTRP